MLQYNEPEQVAIFPEVTLNVDMDPELGAEVELKESDSDPEEQKLLLETDPNPDKWDCIFDDSSGEEDSWYNAFEETFTPLVDFKNNLDSLTNQHVQEFHNANTLPLCENLKQPQLPSTDTTSAQTGSGTVIKTSVHYVVENLEQTSPLSTDITSVKLGRVAEMKEMPVYDMIEFESPEKVSSKSVIKLKAVELPMAFHHEDGITNRKPFQSLYKCESYLSAKQKSLHEHFICNVCGMKFGYKNKDTSECPSGSVSFITESLRSQLYNHTLTCTGTFNHQPTQENDFGFRWEICDKNFCQYSHCEFHWNMDLISEELPRPKMAKHKTYLQPQVNFDTHYVNAVTKKPAVQEKQKTVDTASSQICSCFFKLGSQSVTSNFSREKEQHQCQCFPCYRMEFCENERRTSLIEGLWERSDLQLKVPSSSEMEKSTVQRIAESGLFGNHLPLSVTASCRENVHLSMEQPTAQNTSESNFQFPLSSDYIEIMAIKSICEICGNVYDAAELLAEKYREEDVSLCNACRLELMQDCHISKKPKISHVHQEPCQINEHNRRKPILPSPDLQNLCVYNLSNRHSCHDQTKTISHSALSSDIDKGGQDECRSAGAENLKSESYKREDIWEKHCCKTEEVCCPADQKECANNCVDEEGLENSWKKPFKCGLCGAAYVARSSCIEHMYTHLKEFNSQVSPNILEEFSDMHEACSEAACDYGSVTYELLLMNAPIPDSVPQLICPNASDNQESACCTGSDNRDCY